MASTSYSAVEVLDFLDADSSDSGSSGEEKDDIYCYRRPCIRVGGPGPVSGLVDQTPSTLILTMGLKKMIEVSLSFSCLSLEN